jgi:hypothetical protein
MFDFACFLTGTIQPERQLSDSAAAPDAVDTLPPSGEARPGAPLLDRSGAGLADRPWRRALTQGSILFAISKVGLVALSLVAWIGDGSAGLSPGRLAHLWSSRWDSAWFSPLAIAGYPPSEDAAHAAFFPLYPGLIWLTKPLFGGNIWHAGLVVANLAMLAALVVLYRLAEHEFGTDVADRTILLMVAFPTAFFLSAAYNIGLFIAFAAASVYAMRRGHWWLAGITGALATATRSAGILLVLAFAFEYARQHGWWRLRWTALYGAIIPLGLAAVAAVSYRAYGDPLAFSHAQTAHWGRRLTWPFIPYIDSVRLLIQRPRVDTVVWLHNLLELATVTMLLVLLVLALVGRWKVRPDQILLPLFGLALTLYMISFPSTFTKEIPYPLVSTSRIGLEVFPAFMMLAVLSRHPTTQRVLIAVFLPLQGVLAAHFLRGGWVA